MTAFRRLNLIIPVIAVCALLNGCTSTAPAGTDEKKVDEYTVVEPPIGSRIKKRVSKATAAAKEPGRTTADSEEGMHHLLPVMGGPVRAGDGTP